MGTITFTGEKVDRIKDMVRKAHIPANLMLVGDQGVYLMNSGKDASGNKLHTPGDQVYADHLSPDDEDWFEHKGDTFGHDDGCDTLPLTMFADLFDNPQHNKLVMEITPKHITAYSKRV